MMIQIKKLGFSYDKKNPVLKNISVNIPEGSVTTILGPNGSGKTTLLHLILGILVPSQGKIFFDKKERCDYSRSELSKMIGLVPQDETVPFDLSLEEFVLLGRAPYLGIFEMPGEDDKNISVEAIKLMELECLCERSVPTLSGGEKQLAVIARAIAQRTRILLMDEPTAHLDLANRAKVLEMIHKLTAMGITVVVTTHDPNAASIISDNIILMKKGSLVASGSLKEIFTSEYLSETYGIPVEIAFIKDRPIIL